MGLLDCFGTFLAAMGSVYTPGQVHTHTPLARSEESQAVLVLR